MQTKHRSTEFMTDSLHRLAQPAIRLANRLSFARKTVWGAVVVAALLALLSVLSYVMLSESIGITENERESLHLLERQVAFWEEVVDSRQRFGSGAGATITPDNVLVRSRGVFPETFSRKNPGQLSVAAAQVAGLENSTSPDRRFVAYTMLSQSVLENMESGARNSGMLGDAEINVVGNTLIRDFPLLLENIAKQYAAASLNNEELLTYAAGAQLIVTDSQERVRQGVVRLQSLGGLDTRAMAEFNTWFAIVQDYVRGGTLSENDIRKGFSLLQSLVVATDRHLEGRLTRERMLGLIMLGAMLLSALGVGYFVLGTVLGIRQALNALEKGSLAFSEGQLEQRIQIESQDEFYVVASNFNAVADEFVRLLRAQEDQARESQTLLQQLVTERTAALTHTNSELTTTIDMLRKAQDELVQSEKMAALGGLVAGVAHEVNTPLGLAYTIVTHLQDKLNVLKGKFDAGKLSHDDFQKFLGVGTDSLRHAVGNLHRAAGLIDSFKRIAVDQSSDVRRPFDLDAYLGEVVSSLSSVLRKGGHRVEINVAGTIVFDSFPGALAQVATNIILNAVIHGFEGRRDGTIRIECAMTTGHACQMVFTDDGKGMPEAVVRRVFEPFFTTRRGQGGSGLGLNIVYNLVAQQLGGTIRCESEEGVGTSFILALPLSPVR